MFIIQGQSGSINAIVAASSVEKAIFHFRRMSQSGLHPIVRSSDGEICSARALLAVSKAHAAR